MARPALVREILRLVLGILVVDAVAIGMFYALGIGRMAQEMRLGFMVLWIGATLVVVLPALARIRRLRGGGTER